MLPLPSLTPLLTLFARWAALREEIVALALVGSYARGAARPDSDVDLVVLTTDPDRFRQQTDWVQEIPWSQLQLHVVTWQDEDYGPLWSRRLTLSNGLEIEVGFTSPQWAAIDPCDEGTRQVIADGCWIVLDPSGLLNRLVQSVKQQ